MPRIKVSKNSSCSECFKIVLIETSVNETYYLVYLLLYYTFSFRV